MMTKQTAAAIEQIKRNLRSLRALANELNERDLWEEAQVIHADADCIAEAIEALELDAQEENTDGELLAA
jgi:hypothetical protein